ADGRYVAFVSRASNLVPGDTNLKDDIFVHDCLTGLTTRASVDSPGAQWDLISDHPSISGDGRYVAFDAAPYLFDSYTVYVRDLVGGSTAVASLDANGNPANNF